MCSKICIAIFVEIGLFYKYRILEKPDFYKICYTFLAELDSKIYLVKTVAKSKK